MNKEELMQDVIDDQTSLINALKNLEDLKEWKGKCEENLKKSRNELSNFNKK